MKDQNASPMSRGSARALQPARLEVAAATSRPVGSKSSARALTPSHADPARGELAGRPSIAAGRPAQAE
jgi:hypothetical protein